VIIFPSKNFNLFFFLFLAELTGENQVAMTGFVFRENKFMADPGTTNFITLHKKYLKNQCFR
jgi:hypothetical protein